MKIGIYDPYLDDIGGGEKYMMTLASCLAQEHEVSVFWDNKEDIKKLEERFAIDFRNIAIKHNIFSPHVSTWQRMLETKKYDVLIVLSDGSIPLTLSKKLILHIQQPLDSHIVTFKSKLKLSRVHSIFYNSVYSSTFNKNILKGVKSRVIYPPVTLGTRDQGLGTRKENIILHVGRFRVTNVKNADYKKQQTMVEAFKQMIDNGLKGWKFVVATSIHDTTDPAFQQMIKSAENYPIEFLINKSNKTLWHTYNKAKIYWHASGYGEDLDQHPEYAEHFGISTVEAMGAGAVPVVINAGGQKEIVRNGENGYLWDTLEQLAEKTEKLIVETNVLHAFSQQAMEDAKQFSMERFCREVNQLVTQ